MRLPCKIWLWDSTHSISTQPAIKLGGEATSGKGSVIMLHRCVDLIIIRFFMAICQEKMNPKP